MAIHPTLQTAAPGTLTAQQARAISAWTEQTTASLQNLTISQDASTVAAGTVLRGTSVSLTIPLDDHPSTTEPRPAPRAKIANGAGEERPQRVSLSYRHREPSRRDSLKRREALLKGKEGSRRRQRWENGMSRMFGRYGMAASIFSGRQRKLASTVVWLFPLRMNALTLPGIKTVF